MEGRIVVLGAGTGGTLTANLLASELKPEIKSGKASIQVIEQHGEHTFQPGNLDVAFRGTDPERFLREAAPLVNKRATLLRSEATHIDADDRKVHLSDGPPVEYDHLVIATGADARPDLIPGLDKAHSFHAGPLVAQHLWDDISRMDRGRFVVAITEMPYKCPPSPNEACFLADEHFRARGVRDQTEVEMLTPMPRAYPAEAISKQVEERFEAQGIGLHTFFMVSEVDPDKKQVISMEGDELPYDLLAAVPPHRGAQVIQRSGIGDAEGWMPVDKQTMRAEHDGMYAIGDCTALPISKSGVVAHLESLVVVKNLVADIRGAEEEWAYNGRINCPMEVGDHRLLWVSATYDTPPVPDKPTHVKYGMKKAFNRMYWQALSGKLEPMFSWYFGETAEKRLPEAPGDEESVEAPGQ